jgi:hypothetical protein
MAAISLKGNKDAIESHISNKNNPHGLTPASIGAATADHTHANASQTKAGLMSPADKVKLDNLDQVEAPVTSVQGKTGDVILNPSDLGIDTTNFATKAELNEIQTEVEIGISSDITILQRNFLDMLTMRELEGMSTGADAGYWWDLFVDESKMASISGLVRKQESGQYGYLEFGSEQLSGEVLWKPFNVGFVTDALRYYQEREVSVMSNVVRPSSAGQNVVEVEKYSVTMKEV